MKKGRKVFVRIDYKNKDSETTPKGFQDHLEYLKGLIRKVELNGERAEKNIH